MRQTYSILNRLMVTALGFTLVASSASAQEYKIKLARLDKVGNEFVATVSSSSSQTIDATINGQPQMQKVDAFKAHLHGTIKVLAVNEKTGNASKVRCTVDKLTKDAVELYPAGTMIYADKKGQKTTFTIDGAPVDGDNAKVLDSLINIEASDRTVTDDELTGTDQPKKVGDAWPINAEKVAKEISDGGLPVTGQDLKGETKLVEVKKVDGIEMMVVTTTVTSDGFKKAMPDGSAISDGKLQAEVSFVLSTDGVSPATAGSNKVHADMTIKLPGGVGTAKIVSDREVKEERERVKE